MKIQKNDKVTLNQPLTLAWRNEPLPAGTEMIVWRVKRDGTLFCSGDATQGSYVAVKAEQVTKIARNCSMPKIGDLFHASWGYDQTNETFFQVVNVGGKTIEVREIAGQSKYDGPMCGHTKPTPNHFVSEPKRHLVKFDGNDRPYFKWKSYAHAWPVSANQEYFFSEWH